MRPIQELIDHLAALQPEQLDMMSPLEFKGKACIAGHAKVLLKSGSDFTCAEALGAFGMSSEHAHQVAFPEDQQDAWYAKPRHAVKLLEIYRDETVIDWDRALEDLHENA